MGLRVGPRIIEPDPNCIHCSVILHRFCRTKGNVSPVGSANCKWEVQSASGKCKVQVGSAKCNWEVQSAIGKFEVQVGS